MIQLLSSYLFAEPTHLNSFYIRKSDETQQFWTQAHAEALAVLAEAAEEPERKANLEFIAETMKLRLATADREAGPSADALRAYVGTYGPRVVTLEGGTLRYRRGDGPLLDLEPVGGDLFLFAGETAFRLRFERDAGGRVVRIVGLYADGREEPHDREE